MARVPLVELVVAGDEHRGRPSRRAPRPPHLLAHRRERAREAVEHHRVEGTDVDAELERARCHDTAELAARQLRLELAPLVGEVAGAVRGDGRRRRRRRVGARCSASMPRACVATSSAPLRLRVNASVWCPSATKRDSSIAVSTFADARVPVRTSINGRCHTAKLRSACGEPSPSIASTGSPHSRDASSAGLPIVALVKQKVGSEP